LWWQLAEHRARVAEAALAQVRARIAAVADSLRAAGRGHAREPARAVLLPASDLAALGRLGLEDPVRQILGDLERHPELIPFPGVEGGTMRFYPSQSAVLTREWAYGYFEDGHIAGRGLFEYRVGPGGRLSWKRIAAKLD